MAKKDLTVKVRIDGINQTLAALSRLPKDAQDEIRAVSAELAKALAVTAAQAARTEGRQAALVAVTVKAGRDRVPVINAGGARRVGRNREPAYKVLFGSEFGANYYKQFKPHLGAGSYWFFKTVDDEQAEISRAWLDAADEIVERFGD